MSKIVYLSEYKDKIIEAKKVVSQEEFIEGDLNASNMLRAIADQEPNHAFVIVWPKDDSMPTYHSSTGDIPVVLMRTQQFIHKYFNNDFVNDEND